MKSIVIFLVHILVCEVGLGASSSTIDTQSHHKKIITWQYSNWRQITSICYLIFTLIHPSSSQPQESSWLDTMSNRVDMEKGSQLMLWAQIETLSCVTAHEPNEEWASMIEKYVKQIKEMLVELCATTKELEESIAMIL